MSAAAAGKATAKAKAKAAAKAKAPKLIRSETLPLQDISVAEDSGWREIDSERVEELEKVILDGGWGATSLKGPSLISDDSGKLQHSTTDGKTVLFEGKHLVQALLNLKNGKYDVIPMEEMGDWLVEPLEEIFKSGLKMEVYQFPEYDRLTHECWQALAHEAESNKLLHTTLNQKAQLMKKYFVREGRDWSAARDAVLTILGSQKTSTVNRWITISRDLSESVLDHLKKVKDVPQNFVVGNRYLVGKGEESRFKLSDEWGKVAFDMWQMRREGGALVNAEQFQQEYCLPAKHMESWNRSQVKIFGVVATGFSAYSRCVSKMKTETGRRNVVTWLRDPELRKRPNFGLEELTALVEEMQRTKAGTNKSQQGTDVAGAGSSAPGAGDAGSNGGPGDSQGSAAPDADTAKKSDDEDDGVGIMDMEEATKDPVLEKAQLMVTTDMATVSVHQNEQAWAEEVASSVFSSSKVVVAFECPTSRVSVFHDLMKLSSHLPQNTSFSVWMNLGFRLGLLGSMMEALQKRFPGRPVYAVQMAVGRQSERVKPSYGLYMPMDAKLESGCPTSVNVAGCRAISSEGIRLVCANENCHMRPKNAAASSGSTADIPDIPVEDTEEPDFEACFEAGEDEDDNEATIPMETEEPALLAEDKKAKAVVVSLWPYAIPISLQKCILSTICRASERTHLLLLTRTAHPGSIIAGRECGLKVIALQQGVSSHSAAHGAALLQAVMTSRKMTAARAVVGNTSGQKRVHSSDLQFIALRVEDEDQTIRVRDIEPHPDSKWRAGMNKMPTLIEEKVVEQVQREIESFGMTISKIDNVEHLVTKKSLKENQEVMSLNGLTFDSTDKLRRFIETAGKEFLVPILRLDNIHLDDQLPPKVGSLYHVVTGAGKYIRHYASCRKSSNVVLAIDTSKGLNDGLVTVRVRTRNKVGIAQGTPLLLNFGQDYDHEAIAKAVAEEGNQPKKLKTMLGVYFAKLSREAVEAAGSSAAQAAGSSAAQGPGSSSGAGSAAASAGAASAASAAATGTAAAASAAASAGAAGAASAGAAEAAGTASAGGEAAAAAAASAALAAAAAASTGPAMKGYVKDNETLVGEVTEPMNLGLAFAAPQGGEVATLTLCCPSLLGNKKLSPKTILLKVYEGKVSTSTAGGMKWHFSKTKSVMVVEKDSSGKLGAQQSLHDYISKSGATSVIRHNPSVFAKKPPLELTSSAEMEFVPKDPSVAALLKFCLTRSDIQLVWQVRLNSEKAVTPHGIVVYTKKQLIMPVSGRLPLN